MHPAVREAHRRPGHLRSPEGHLPGLHSALRLRRVAFAAHKGLLLAHLALDAHSAALHLHVPMGFTAATKPQGAAPVPGQLLLASLEQEGGELPLTRPSRALELLQRVLQEDAQGKEESKD